MKIRSRAKTFAIFLATAILLAAAPASAGDKLNFLIIYPGGPDAAKEGDKIIGDFISMISHLTSIPAGDLEGGYYNDMAAGTKALDANPNSFVMGSLGLYLSGRKKYNFKPLAAIQLPGGAPEKYYLLTKAGAYKSLGDLKGKTIAGSVLYEDTNFLNTIVFDGKYNISSDFKPEPTDRPLSSIRKVSRGKLDAVLVNSMQYESLKGLPLFSGLDTLYSTPALPAVGLIVAETPVTKKYADKVAAAVKRMCDTPQGGPVCKNFSIGGFAEIPPGSFDEVIKKYDAAAK